MVHPLSSMRQKQADPSLFTALINELPTHKSLSCIRYLYHYTPLLSIAPSRLLPVVLFLSLDGRSILSASPGLEPEDHSRQTSVFCPDGAAGKCRAVSAVAVAQNHDRHSSEVKLVSPGLLIKICLIYVVASE